MKNKNSINFKALLSLGFFLTIATGCERELSEDAVLETYPAAPEVFIDGFSGGLEYRPFAGSKLDAFTVDDQTFYEGEASMRLDIPNFGDPDGSFAGAIFPDYGQRDLSGFDALTFWAKATKAATINEIGFGNDFGENKYIVTKNNLRITTGWKKYIIPIPDPSKLTAESGMFWYSEGPENGDGYTIWVDELKYEKLGTIAQPRPAIFSGQDLTAQSFIGASITASGLEQTFNLANGNDETVSAAPAYFEFKSSDTNVATINELGEIAIVGAGTAKITAVLGGVRAAGSLTIESIGNYVAAPTPTQDPANVISIFSEAYTGVADLNIAVFNNADIAIEFLSIGGDNIIAYENLSFVGIGWEGTSDVSSFGFLHVDVQVTQDFDPSQNLVVELLDFGPNNADGGGDDTAGGYTIAGSQLTKDAWVSIDIPLNAFTNATGGGGAGNPNLSNIARVIFVGSGGISNILVDNIYFYK